ncbi:paraquat-inducible protein A [Escherichia coli]
MRSIGEELPRGDYQRCPQCDMLFSLPEINSHQSAYCPRCQAKIRDGRDGRRLAAMAFTMLLLMPFAWGEPLLHIWLLGIRIDANVMQGIWQMTKQGDTITGAMVVFFLRYWCPPYFVVSSIAYLWFGNRLGMNLRPVLLMLERLKEWVMLDIYLVGIGVASIKVQDLCPYPGGCRLVLFCGVGDFNDGDVVTS